MGKSQAGDGAAAVETGGERLQGEAWDTDIKPNVWATRSFKLFHHAAIQYRYSPLFTTLVRKPIFRYPALAR
jgi:hypothetical protein